MTIKGLTSKIKNGLKKTPGFIGGLFFAIIFFGSIIITLRTIYQNSWMPLVLIIGCPFMAVTLKSGKGTMVVVAAYVTLLLTVWCGVCIVSQPEKQQSYVANLFLKGERKHHKVLIEESVNSDDNISPAHYETKYSFELAPDQSTVGLSLIRWALPVLPIVIMVFIYFALCKHLKEAG